MSALSTATASQVNFMVGLDQTIYKDVDVKTNDITGTRKPCVPWAGQYLALKVTDGFAGSVDASVEVPTTVDMVGETFLVFNRPAIKGVHAPGNGQGYPCEDKCARLRADERAALRFAPDEFDAEEEDEDEGGASSSYRRKKRASAGLDEFIKTQLGGSAVRSKAEMEIDARSLHTTATRSPGRQKHAAWFVNGWVYRAAKSVTSWLGAMAVDTITGQGHFALHDVSVSASKKPGLKEVTGQTPPCTREEQVARLIDASSRPEEGWLPLAFWHCDPQAPERWHKSFAADWTGLRYTTSIAGFTELIQRRNRETKVVKANGSDLQPRDLRVSLIAHCISIDPTVREALLENEKQDIYVHTFSMRNVARGFDSIPVKFNHPTVGFHWFFHRKACERDNDHVNWWGIWGMEPMESASLTTNGQVRQNELSGRFYRIIQAWSKCESTPESALYSLGFSRNLAGHADNIIKGSLNFIRYNDAALHLKLQPHLEDEGVTCTIIRKILMLIRYSKGLGVPAYGTA